MFERLKWWAASFAAIALLVSAGATQARSIESAIQTDLGAGETPQRLAFDDDAQIVVDTDAGEMGVIDAGDRLRGHLVFRNITRTFDEQVVTLGGSDVPTEVNELTGYFELEVKSKSGNATDGYIYQFGSWSSGGSIAPGDPGAMIALYEDASQNGVLSGMNIPHPTLTDGELWGVLGTGGEGNTLFEVRSEVTPDGTHRDDASAAFAPTNLLIGSGAVRLNLIDQGGAAITDESHGVYRFSENAFGTEFAGTFDLFGAGGTGADFTAALEFRSTVAIIPLPPAAMIALPAIAGLAWCGYRRKRLV